MIYANDNTHSTQNFEKKMTKRTRNPAAKRQSIIDAAVIELSIKGFHGTNTAEVARLAKCSVGTVFKIFGTKEHLANEVFLECREKYHLYIPKISLDNKPREQFARLIQAVKKMYENHPHHFIFFETQLHGAFIDKRSIKIRDILRDEIKVWVEVMQDKQIIKPIPSEIVRAIVLGPIVRMVRESIDGNIKIKKKYFKILEEITWQAISVNQ